MTATLASAPFISKASLSASSRVLTDLCDHQMIKDMHMTPVNTLEEALKLAFEMKGADAKVAVIPDGLGVVVAQH